MAAAHLGQRTPTQTHMHTLAQTYHEFLTDRTDQGLDLFLDVRFESLSRGEHFVERVAIRCCVIQWFVGSVLWGRFGEWGEVRAQRCGRPIGVQGRRRCEDDQYARTETP